MIFGFDVGVYALLLDFLVAGLLIATIAYAWVLNRKLSALRDAKPEMEALIARFVQATGRAENGLAEIRQTAEQTGEALRQATEEGRAIADDLVFLVERAGKLADRLTVPQSGRPVNEPERLRAEPDADLHGLAERPDELTSKLRALR